jgi:hypothetical protein
VVGTGSWCFVTDRSLYADTIEITGTMGKIILPCFAHDGLILTTSEGTKKITVQNPENIQYHLIQRIVDELRGLGESPSTGKTAARTSAVLDEMVKNYYSNKTDENKRTKGSCRNI